MSGLSDSRLVGSTQRTLTLEQERENETIRPPPEFICVSLLLVLPLILSWDGVV